MENKLSPAQENIYKTLKSLPARYRVNNKAGGLIRPEYLEVYDRRSLRGLYSMGYLETKYDGEGYPYGVEIK